MVGALDKFCKLDAQLFNCSTAEESDESAGKQTVSEDIDMSETYITMAEDVICEANCYLETHPAPPPPAEPPAVATLSDSKGIRSLVVQ